MNLVGALAIFGAVSLTLITGIAIVTSFTRIVRWTEKVRDYRKAKNLEAYVTYLERELSKKDDQIEAWKAKMTERNAEIAALKNSEGYRRPGGTT
jgi:peptidoglycan hydrolase CwlO-like protein